MKFINLLLLGALALGLEACTVKITDKSGEQEATRSFLNDYAEKSDIQGTNIRTHISQNGSISFQSIINERCTISFDGRVDRATLSNKTHYIVRYHYDRMTSPSWTCSATDTPKCQSQLESCEKARSAYYNRTRQAGSMIFRVGEEAKNIVLFP
jgi:hypothetical protein